MENKMNFDPQTGEPLTEEAAAYKRSQEAYQNDSQYYQSSAQQYRTPSEHERSAAHKRPVRDKKPKKDHKILKLVASAVAFGLIAGIVFQGVDLAANRLFGKKADPIVQEIEGTVEAVPDTSVPSVKVAQTDVASVAEVCMPSIVSITNQSVGEVMSWFGVQSQEMISAGSGIIVGENDSELLIATNNHVIEGANTLTVTFADDSCCEAKLKGTDAQNDVAVIAVKLSDIEESTKNAIKIATLGDSDALCVGEPAIAIGNALGYGQSVTAGIVSATNRTFTSDGSLSGTFIQTDAAINPGNSGGALLNALGEVIGINVAKEASSQVDAMGYAIPITYAKPILDDLMNRETRDVVPEEERGVLGIYGADVDAATAAKYNMPEGVYISELVKDGAAEEAGLDKGDVITKLDGMSVSSMTALKRQLTYYRSGEVVTVTVQHPDGNEYKTMEVDVTLKPASTLEEADDDSDQEKEQEQDDNENWNGYGGNGNFGGFDLNDLFNMFR